MKANIIIAGVGGQGTLLASRIIGGAAIQCGYDVKVSEVHGMSQRGGSVITYVRYSDTAVRSPIIDPGRADMVLAFEMLEAYRCVSFLKPGGRMIINTQKIDPMPVITGTANYPSDIPGKLSGLGISPELVDAVKLAQEAGDARAVNVALIGYMSAKLPIAREIWESVLRETVKPAFLAVNTKAFALGLAAANPQGDAFVS